jgi:SAM-dependent methyltransferase
MPMEKLDADYWQNRYDIGTDAWDLGAPSTPLATYIDQLTDKDLRILIPGCGPAWEGQYLHERGFRNVWLMDLTGGPFEAFLQRCPGFPQEHLLIGDFFGHSGQYDRIIEQTFFCALDPALRGRYVEKMRELLAPDGKLVGVLFDDPQPGKTPGEPPYGGSRSEYEVLFKQQFGRVKVEPCYNSIAPRAGREAWIAIGH